jgi:hypothetical protein
MSTTQHDATRWANIDEEDDYVLDISLDTNPGEVSEENQRHIATEKRKITEGLRYIRERQEMEEKLRRLDVERRKMKRRTL